jgi:hypothetical protein
MNYKIYQVDPHDCDYAFEWWSWAQNRFNFKDYTLTYEGEIEVEDVNKTLEDLFRIFNVERPSDFRGHSLSVSDIIEINNKYYYCDSVGWTEITKYIR